MDEGEIDTIWLIPSGELKTGKNKLRIVASKKDNSNYQWSIYKLEKEQLVEELDTLLNEII
jgi:hypothetical protein